MTTTLQKLAAVFGVVFFVVAILGFITPNGGMSMQPTDPATAAKLLGIFPVNLLQNVVHLLFGVWGLAASRSWSGSKSYFTTSGVIYAALAVCALLSPSGFGLMPIGAVDTGILAIAMLVIGLTAKPAPTVTV
jgi:hypothetical protein